jgi:histidinol-phosphate aminotransferase
LIAGNTIAKKFTPQILPFVLSKPSVYAALSALKDTSYIQENIESISKEKTRIKKELENIGVTVYSSETNFLMIASDIPLLSKKLYARGIIVMDLSNQMSKQFLRITIGKVQENDIFLKNLKEIIQLQS